MLQDVDPLELFSLPSPAVEKKRIYLKKLGAAGQQHHHASLLGRAARARQQEQHLRSLVPGLPHLELLLVIMLLVLLVLPESPFGRPLRTTSRRDRIRSRFGNRHHVITVRTPYSVSNCPGFSCCLSVGHLYYAGFSIRGPIRVD